MNNLGLFFLENNPQLIFWIPSTASSLPWLIPGFASCNNPVMTCVTPSILYLTKLYWLSRSTISPQINTTYNSFFLVNNPTENNFVYYTLTFAKVNLAKKICCRSELKWANLSAINIPHSSLMYLKLCWYRWYSVSLVLQPVAFI